MGRFADGCAYKIFVFKFLQHTVGDVRESTFQSQSGSLQSTTGDFSAVCHNILYTEQIANIIVHITMYKVFYVVFFKPFFSND